MTNPPHLETGPMLFTECPLCDQPASIDDETGSLECSTCAIRYQLADEEGASALASAA